MRVVSRSHLGPRPSTVNHLNGESFQQDALLTHRNWQYAIYYLDSKPGVRHLHLARRSLAHPSDTPLGAWQVLEFTDYEQTLDDGHNVASLGICPKDETIHMSWDLHCSALRYRRSISGLANCPETAKWDVQEFSEVLDCLPGVPEAIQDVTYPRFVSMPSALGGDLFFESRTGVAGLGDCWLYLWRGGSWTCRGMYLKGVQNSPYINGIDIDSKGIMHVSWCYRDYVPYERTKVAQQSGPNGPENNHDLHYAYSPVADDGLPGLEWYNVRGCKVSLPMSPKDDTRAFEIKKYSGLLNQEAQCLVGDQLHVLNRETINGTPTWFHLVPAQHAKTALKVPPNSHLPPRGKLVHHRDRLLALLQTGNDLVVYDVADDSILGRIAGGGGNDCQDVLYDRVREDVLSLYLGIGSSLVCLDVDVGGE